MPALSVIVPFYNEEACLEACLRSILASRWKDFELLAVDDGSTDASASIAAGLAAKDRRLRLLRGAHRGPGAARNQAARAAKAKVLVFVDADMTCAPDFLAKISAPVRAGREDGTYVVDELVSNPENRWSRAWSQAHRLPPTRRLPVDSPARADTYRCARKAPFLKAGGYREERGVSEDELDTRVLKPALKVPGAVLYHANPASAREVWMQARWFGRGKASYEAAGTWLKRLATHCLPRSLAAAALGAARHRSFFFAAFKLWFDAAVFWGLLDGRLTGRKAR